MTEILLLAGAKADFDTAFKWYAVRSESAAVRITEQVADAIERASHDPTGLAGWIQFIDRPA